MHYGSNEHTLDRVVMISISRMNQLEMVCTLKILCTNAEC